MADDKLNKIYELVTNSGIDQLRDEEFWKTIAEGLDLPNASRGKKMPRQEEHSSASESTPPSALINSGDIREVKGSKNPEQVTV